jgi:hypothetical protein
MPNNNMQWVETQNLGNPTKSRDIAKFLKTIMKKEAARLGMPSQARRAIHVAEFEQAIDFAEAHANKHVGLWGSAYSRYQFSMIARVDDCSKLRAPDLGVFHQYPDYGVSTRLCWSKNVMEERDAPTQVLIGADNSKFCVLSGMGLWLEAHFTKNPEANPHYFGVNGLRNPETIKKKYSDFFKGIFDDDDFESAAEGPTGTHSTRKFATSQARKSGMTKDDIDHRGRWKRDNRQQDTYADTTIPFVDAKVAAALCNGGPITYVVKEGSGISDDWILQHVVPSMRRHLDRQVCVVFGRALLWRIFYDIATHKTVVPEDIEKRVVEAYAGLGDRCTLAEGENPVKKMPLGVDGVDANLVMDILFEDGDDAPAAPAAANEQVPAHAGGDRRVAQRMGAQENRLLCSQVLQLRRSLTEMGAQLDRRDINFTHQLARLNRNVARLAVTPGRRTTAPRDNQVNGQVLVASLGSCPRTLHDLWVEWEFGTAGKKAAKNFTAQERGKNKYKFYLRKFFWKQVSEMVRSGMSAQVACDKIYEVYGVRAPVSAILKKLQRDSRTGGHPALRTLYV